MPKDVALVKAGQQVTFIKRFKAPLRNLHTQKESWDIVPINTTATVKANAYLSHMILEFRMPNKNDLFQTIIHEEDGFDEYLEFVI